MSSIVLIGMAQGVLLCVILCQKRYRSMPNAVLSAWIALFVVDMALGAVDRIRQVPYLSVLVLIREGFPFLYAPFLYLYIEALVGRFERVTVREAAHCVPYACVLCLRMTAVDQVLAAAWPPMLERAPWLLALSRFGVFNIALYTLALSYHVAIVARLRAYRKAARLDGSAREASKSRWLVALTAISCGVWIVAVAMPFVDEADPLLLCSLYAVVIYVFAYRIISAPDMFTRNAALAAAPLEAKGTDGLRADAQKELLERFITYIESHESYLDPDASMGDLCAGIGAPVHRVSSALNRVRGQSFYALMNGYRVREARRLLSDPAFADTSVLSIGLEAGFNSKSTFNDAFKRIVGMTPTEYRSRAFPDQGSE